MESVVRDGGIAFEVFRPAGEARAALVCFPGGGMTRRYFDLAAAGYSFASYACERGFTVVLADHPGTGDSETPDDPWTLTPRAVAKAEIEATKRIVASLPSRPPAVIGVGHSAGGHVLIHQQAQSRYYDGLALLGWAGRGLPEFLSERDRSLAGMLDGLDNDALDAELVISAKLRYDDPLPVLNRGSSQMLIKSALPDDVRQSLAAARAPLLAVLGHASMIGGTTARAGATVDVPVFLGVGEHDIAADHHAIPASFPASDDVSLFVLKNAGHNHNVEPGREELWARVTDWAGRVAAGKASRRKQ
ncbi:MAG: alpha/beta hydrolase [Streptosporangiales bacterium]|nr:alpha/beta hydrolase [Streptosporangiales bacterium]